MSVNRHRNINKRLVGTISTTTGTPGNAGQIGPIKTPYLIRGLGATPVLGSQCFGAGCCGGIFRSKESNCGVKELCQCPVVDLGGLLICRAANVNWVVARCTSQVYRSWHARNDAATRAQQVTGCTGWFVPTRPQLQNPGFACKTYWDTHDGGTDQNWHWSATQGSGYMGCALRFHDGNTCFVYVNCVYPVRAFRCVTY